MINLLVEDYHVFSNYFSFGSSQCEYLSERSDSLYSGLRDKIENFNLYVAERYA